jgi:hydrogenase maturation factor
MMDGPAVVVGRVVELHEGTGGPEGRVSVRGARVEVAFDLLPEVKVGDVVLFHAGVALARLQEERLDEGDNRVQEG